MQLGKQEFNPRHLKSSFQTENTCLTMTTEAMDMVCRVFRLWSHRCPNSTPVILKNIIRHTRLFPCHYMALPLLLSSIGGFTTVLPSNSPIIMTFDNKPCSILAQELNGAEGRNLDAVIARLKQMCYQRRQLEILQTGNTSYTHQLQQLSLNALKLPLTMTTLVLSSKIYLPYLCQQSLFGESPIYYIRLHLPLATSSTAYKPTQKQSHIVSVTRSRRGLGEFEWCRRRLGRLTTGHEGEILSKGIFTTAKHLSQIYETDSGSDHQPMTYKQHLDSSIAPEWASWDRLLDLIYGSFEEEAIEAMFESDRVPLFPLGLSSAAMSSFTGSATRARLFSRLLMSSTTLADSGQGAANPPAKSAASASTSEHGSTATIIQPSKSGAAQTAPNVAESLNDYKKLQRLESIARHVKYFKVEDFAEYVTLLIQCTFSSNIYIHAATAHCTALLTWTQGPPVLDLLVRVASYSLNTLSSSLTRPDVSQESLAQHLCEVARIILFVKHTLEMFPYCTLEAAIVAVRLASESLHALQEAPVASNSECPSSCILVGLFECILLATVQLFDLGITEFLRFINWLSHASPKERQAHGLLIVADSPECETSTSSVAKFMQPSQFRNTMLDNQFTMSMHTLKYYASPPPPSRTASSDSSSFQSPTSWPSLTLGSVATFIPSLRKASSGLCAVLNEVPIAWTYSSNDNKPSDNSIDKSEIPWTGLSLNVVMHVVKVFYKMTTNQFLAMIFLFDLPPSFLETYILSGILAPHQAEKSSILNTSKDEMSDSQMAPSSDQSNSENNASQEKPEAIQISVDPVSVLVLHSFLAKIHPAVQKQGLQLLGRISQDPGNSEACSHLWSILDITDITLACIKRLFYLAPTTSASLLLSVLTPVSVTSVTLPVEDFTEEDQAKTDMSGEMLDLYGDLVPSVNDMMSQQPSCIPAEENLRESLLKSHASALQTMGEKISESPADSACISQFSHIKVIVKRCSHHILDIRSLIQDRLTLDLPPVILSFENFCDNKTLNGDMGRGKVSDTEQTTPQLSELVKAMFECSSPTRGISEFSSISVVNQLIDRMSANAAWRFSALLMPVDMVAPEQHEGMADSSSGFMFLPEIVNSAFTGDLLSTDVLLNSSFAMSTVRSANKGDSSSSIGNRKPTTSTNPSWQQAVSDPSADYFRYRKSKTSTSRPPSKHVDEFLAEQQRQEAQQESSKQAASASEDSQISDMFYEEIPQWAEFVANGAQQGLNVMEILKTPQLLHDPDIESRFRKLVDAHESIQSLFKMMELNV